MTYGDLCFAVESEYADAGLPAPTGLSWFFAMAEAVRLE